MCGLFGIKKWYNQPIWKTREIPLNQHSIPYWNRWNVPSYTWLVNMAYTLPVPCQQRRVQPAEKSPVPILSSPATSTGKGKSTQSWFGKGAVAPAG